MLITFSFLMSRDLGWNSTETNILVSKSKLIELLQICPKCNQSTNLKEQGQGSLVSFHIQCSQCQFEKVWNNQNTHGNTPLLNLLLSAAINFTGSSFRKIESFFKVLNVNIISETNYYIHVKKYLNNTIHCLWKQQQALMISEIHESGQNLVLAGDMRADSPGYSAKYGSYSLMNMNSNQIMHFDLVQVCSFFHCHSYSEN